MRRNVIQEEPMDREESLKVYKDKLLRFEDLKKEQLEKELVDNINIKKIDSINSPPKHTK